MVSCQGDMVFLDSPGQGGLYLGMQSQVGVLMGVVVVGLQVCFIELVLWWCELQLLGPGL